MIYVRPSELKTWRRCRRQWEMKYHLELWEDEDTTTSKSASGTIVHLGLAEHYRGGDALAAIRALPASPPRLDAEIMVEDYLNWVDETGADDGWTFEAVEKVYEAEVLPGVTLRGHVDLLAHNEHGVTKLVDHKTVDSLEQYGRQLQVDTQLLSYATLLRINGIEIGGALHNSIKRSKHTARAKGPFVQRNEVTYNVEQLRNHWRAVQAQAAEIASAHAKLDDGADRHGITYPNPTRECTWDCPGLNICTFFDDGTNVDSVINLTRKKAASA